MPYSRRFLPEASFNRVFSLPASVCPCVCVYVRESPACPRDILSAVQARVTEFGPRIENTMVKVRVFFRVWLTLTSKIKLKSKFTPFWVHPREKSPAIETKPQKSDKRLKITWLRSLLFRVAIDLDFQVQI